MTKKTSLKATFIEGSVTRHLVKMCLPALVGLVCTFSFVAFDLYFISLLGTAPLTAFSYCMPVVDFMIGISIGIGIALSSVAARRIGAGQLDKVQCYILHCMLFCFVFGFSLTGIGYITMPVLFRHLGANADSFVFIKSFMEIWYIGIFLIFLIFVMSNALRAYGRPQETAMIQILSALLNFVLDIILIFYFKLGIAGAALAAVLSRTVAVFALIYYLRKFDFLVFDRAMLVLRKIMASWKQMFAIMVPASLTNSISPLANAWSVVLLSKYSQTAVAGFGIGANVQSMSLIPLFALSASIGPIVGQNSAVDQPQRAFSAYKKCVLFSLMWGLFVAFILYFIGFYVAQLFSDHISVVQVATEYLQIVPICYASWGVLMMTNANFNALGHPLRATFLSVLRLIIIFIPLSYVLFHALDYHGIFYAFDLATIFASLVAYYWADYSYKRRMIKLSVA